MSKFQDEVGEWAEKTFTQATDDSIRAHFAREVLELVGITVMEKAIRDTLEKHRVTTPSGETGVPFRIYSGETRKLQTEEEIADCNMLLLHLCHRRQIDLDEAMRQKFEINKVRRWGKPDAEGVCEHIDD